MELNNGIVRFTFDDNTGSVAQITDLSNGFDYLKDPSGNRLFNLIAPTKKHRCREVRPDKVDKPDVQIANDSLTLKYSDMVVDGDPTGITATVTVSLPAGSQEARFNLQIENNGPYRIHEVHFPWIGGWTEFGGTGVDKVTVSHWQDDPHTIFPTHHTHTWGRWNKRKLYAGCFFIPFMDLSGDGQGLSYCVYNKSPRISGILLDDLSPDYENTCLSWAHVAQPYIKPSEIWTSPEVGVGIHHGDWHDTIDRYREFLAPWWQAPNTPARLKETIGYYSIQTTGFMGELCNDWDDIPDIARDCQKYGIDDLCIWDMYAQTYLRPDDGGAWEITPEYEAKMRSALAEINNMGINTSTCVNYRLITRLCKQFPELESEVQKSMYGYQIAWDSYPCSYAHSQWRIPALESGGVPLCQCSPKFHKFAMDLSRQTMDFGFTSLFIDQVFEMFPCFDESHGHKTADDTLELTYNWIKDAAQMVRDRNPEAYVIGEQPEIYNTQVVDIWWDWGKRDTKSEMIRYLLPESLQMWCIDEHERDVVSKAFASGHILALMTKELTGKLSDFPELAAQVARLSQLKKDTMQYVTYGRFMDNRGLFCEGAIGYTYTSDAGIAVALANSKPHEVTVKVVLDPQVFGKIPGNFGILFIEGHSSKEAELCFEDDSITLELTIPAYAAAVWCIPCK